MHFLYSEKLEKNYISTVQDIITQMTHFILHILKMAHITQLRPWQNDIITLLEYRMTHINISSSNDTSMTFFNL